MYNRNNNSHVIASQLKIKLIIMIVEGIYCCSKCGTELFHSTKKYEHSSPWPAFTETVTKDCLSKRNDGPSALKVLITAK